MSADTTPAPAVRAVQDAVAYILRSTQARPQTEAEVRNRLRSRQVPAEVAAAAVDRARRLGAIDDAAFAAAWVADRGAKRGYGTARLRTELHRRLVPAEVIDAALEALSERDEEATALCLARERAQRLPASLPPERAARRVVGFLVRRGYGPSLAQRVAVRATGLDHDWD